MHSLPLFHRIAGRRVVVVGNGDMAEAKRRLVRRAGGICCDVTQTFDAHLAFVALEDGDAASRMATRFKREGLLVNVADRPELCDFTLPSVLDRDPVLVAVSTGGASAGLAKHLRLRLEAILPESLGTLARGLAGMRERLRSRYPDPDERRRVVDEALREGGMLDPFDAASTERLNDFFAQGPEDAQVGEQRVHAFTLTSTDPDDLTLRQARLLGCADYVLHEAAVPETILIRARADASRLQLPHDIPSTGMAVILRLAAA